MSSKEQNPLGPDFAKRVLMVGDAREIIINLTFKEISPNQIIPLISKIALECGYDIQEFSQVFLNELEKKRQGAW